MHLSADRKWDVCHYLGGQIDLRFQPSQDPGHHATPQQNSESFFITCIIAKPVAGGDSRNIKQICNEFLLLKLL